MTLFLMKSADQKARKTQNYSTSDYNVFNTPLLKAIFLLPELILLTSQFPEMGWGKQKRVGARFSKHKSSKINVRSGFVNFALKIRKRKKFGTYKTE